MPDVVRLPARYRWAAAVVAALCFEALCLLKPSSPARFAAGVDTVLAGVGFLSALLCALRAGHEEGVLRKGWSGLAAAAFFFGAGQVAFALETSAQGTRPVTGSSAADVITSLAVPCAVAGLLAFAGSSVAGRLVAALDALTVATALVFTSWALVLRPVFTQDVTTSARVVTLVYVGGTLAMLALVLVLSMRWRGDLHELVLLGIAFAWLSAANAGYGVQTLRGTYRPGDPLIDVSWFGAVLLVGLAAARPPSPPEVDERRRWWLTLFMPYASVLLVLTVSAVRLVLSAPFDAFLVVAGAVLVAGAMLRQLLTLRDYHVLVVTLEQRVAERTESAQRYASQLRALLHDSSDVLAVVSPGGVVAYVSPASWTMFGLPPEDLLGRSIYDLVHPDDRPLLQHALADLRDDGAAESPVVFQVCGPGEHWCAVEAVLSPVAEGATGPGVLLNLRDVSGRNAEQEQLREQALYDPLTSLPNRRVFDDRVQHAFDRARRTGEPVAVLFVDLDKFKRVNDTAGHAVGDAVLVQVARRLHSCLRPSDTAARLGGDEFAVLLEGTSPEHAHEVAARVLEALRPPYRVGDRTLHVTASVGVTSSGGASGATDLVREADAAMYRAKEAGRGRLEVFDAAVDARRLEDEELAHGLKEAMDEDRLQLVFQPVLHARDRRVMGVEALVRWRRAATWVPPARLVPVAEQLGIGPQLDAWVLRHACAQVAMWRHLVGLEGLRAHVNVGPDTLRDPDLEGRLAEVLLASGLPEDALVLELSERAVTHDDEDLFHGAGVVRRTGVHLWLDDVGTGNASLPLVRRLGADGGKVDHTLVRGVAEDVRGWRLVRGVLDLLYASGITTVAEGVERDQQDRNLIALGCTLVQGNLYCPPLPAERLEPHLLRGFAPLTPGAVVPRPSGASVGS